MNYFYVFKLFNFLKEKKKIHTYIYVYLYMSCILIYFSTNILRERREKNGICKKYTCLIIFLYNILYIFIYFEQEK